MMYVPVDIFGGAFSTPSSSSDPPLHLWLSFTSPADLSHIPSGIVDTIVFDYSTWRYMVLTEDVVAAWGRVLRGRGRVVFEAGVAGVRGGDGGWEFDNPTHVTVGDVGMYELLCGMFCKREGKGNGWGGPLGRLVPSKRNDPATTGKPPPFNTRTVLPAPRQPHPPHPLLGSLHGQYRSIFTLERGFSDVLLHSRADGEGYRPYPIRTRGFIGEWFEAVKK